MDQELIAYLDQRFSQLKSELMSEIALELRADIAASAAETRRHFDLVNVLDRWPGGDGRGAAFPKGQASEALAKMVAERQFIGRPVILLGRRLLSLVFAGTVPFYEWRHWWECDIVGIPHPSGLSR